MLTMNFKITTQSDDKK